LLSRAKTSLHKDFADIILKRVMHTDSFKSFLSEYAKGNKTVPLAVTKCIVDVVHGAAKHPAALLLNFQKIGTASSALELIKCACAQTADDFASMFPGIAEMGKEAALTVASEMSGVVAVAPPTVDDAGNKKLEQLLSNKLREKNEDMRARDNADGADNDDDDAAVGSDHNEADRRRKDDDDDDDDDEEDANAGDVSGESANPVAVADDAPADNAATKRKRKPRSPAAPKKRSRK
jgi:hypothetical protein